MSIRPRIFIVEDDDTLHRLPMAQYDRLFARNPKECLPQYANKRVRYALVAVDLYNRKPFEILMFQYSFLTFDTKGKLHLDESEREARLAFDLLEPVDIPSGKVIEASHIFAKKRFKDKYTWTPSPEIEAAIVNEIFEND